MRTERFQGRAELSRGGPSHFKESANANVAKELFGMANYKRRRPRIKSGSRGARLTCAFGSSWPRWFEIEYLRRPKRRKNKRLMVALRKGADPDDLAWPLGNHKPHSYYW